MLLARGFAVRGACRAQAKLPDGVERAEISGIDESTDWTAALDGCDLVIHLAAGGATEGDGSIDPLAANRRINVAGTERLARSAASAGVRRFVHVSTIKVNGEGTQPGKPYTEKDAPSPMDAYGISKWEGEQALARVAQQTGLEVAIVRPPLVYGPGAKGNFAQLMKIVRKCVPMPLGSARNRRDMIYLDNLADACIACATHPGAAGKTFLVCDGDPMSTPELIRRLAKAMALPSRVLPFPPAMLRLAGSLLGKSGQVRRLLDSLEVDAGLIGRELDWKPPFTVDQGLRWTVDAR